MTGGFLEKLEDGRSTRYATTDAAKAVMSVRFVVFYGRILNDAFSEVRVDAADLAALRVIARTELDRMEQYNCAYYNLALGMTQRWIDAGRPR